MAQSSVISIKHSELFRFVLLLYINSTVQERLTALLIWGKRQYFGTQTTSYSYWQEPYDHRLYANIDQKINISLHHWVPAASPDTQTVNKDR